MRNIDNAIGAVLIYSAFTARVTGQTMGADGSGPKALVLYGAPEAAEESARRFLADLQASGAKIESANLVVNHEEYLGHPIECRNI